jgi:argininosuccinate synthase
MYLTLVRFSLQGKDLTPLYSITTPWRIREQSERSGFSSFLVTFFFSFHKEKKKVTKRFEIKEKF